MKEGWTYKKLGEVCEIIGGGTPDKKNSEYYDGNIPWATVRDMNCDLLVSTDYCISEIGLKNSASHLIDKGEIIIATRVGLGKVCKLAQDTAINQDLKGIIPLKDNIDRDFLFYYFKHKAKHIENSGIGATVKGVKLKFIEDLQFPIVDLDEQLTIVARLDSAFAQIDSLKTNAEKQLSEARQLFQKALEEAMTPKEGWEVKTIGEIAQIKIGPFGSLLHKKDYISGGIPLVNPVHMIEGKIKANHDFSISEEKAKELSNYILKENDIIFARRGEVGRCALVSSNENNYLCGTGSMFVRFDKEVDYSFMLLMFSSKMCKDYLEKHATGATMLNINSVIVSNMPLMIPPLPTQHTIVAHLDSLSSNVRALEAKLKKMKDECDALKQAMLREVFE